MREVRVSSIKLSLLKLVISCMQCDHVPCLIPEIYTDISLNVMSRKCWPSQQLYGLTNSSMIGHRVEFKPMGGLDWNGECSCPHPVDRLSSRPNRVMTAFFWLKSWMMFHVQHITMSWSHIPWNGWSHCRLGFHCLCCCARAKHVPVVLAYIA